MCEPQKFGLPLSLRMSRIHFIIPGLLSILAGTACSGPGQAASDSAPATTASPFNDGRFLWVDASETRLHDLENKTSKPLGEGGHVLYSSVSPDRSHATLVVIAGSESRLVLFSSESGQSTRLRSGSASLEYTGSWSPDGSQFAFGYFEPTTVNDRRTFGAGDIRIISLADHAVRRLGCSSSKAVIAWPSSAELLVRSTDNLYRVASSDCGTLQTTDIRRWTIITPSPDGQHLAFARRCMDHG